MMWRVLGGIPMHPRFKPWILDVPYHEPHSAAHTTYRIIHSGCVSDLCVTSADDPGSTPEILCTDPCTI